MRSDDTIDEPLKVIIVEDEPLLAMDLEVQVSEMGHTVIGTAPDAETVFGLIGEAKPDLAPDLALVDLNLRDGLTGPQIASVLSQDKGMIVVFVTGSPDQIPPDYAGAAGAITKPWSIEALEQVMSLVTALRRLGASLPHADLPLVRLAPSFQSGKSRLGK